MERTRSSSSASHTGSGVLLALDRDRLERLAQNRVPTGALRLLADQHTALGGDRLETRSRVHHVADDREPPVVLRADRCEHRLSGVDADP